MNEIISISELVAVVVWSITVVVIAGHIMTMMAIRRSNNDMVFLKFCIIVLTEVMLNILSVAALCFVGHAVSWLLIFDAIALVVTLTLVFKYR